MELGTNLAGYFTSCSLYSNIIYDPNVHTYYLHLYFVESCKTVVFIFCGPQTENSSNKLLWTSGVSVTLEYSYLHSCAWNIRQWWWPAVHFIIQLCMKAVTFISDQDLATSIHGCCNAFSMELGDCPEVSSQAELNVLPQRAYYPPGITSQFQSLQKSVSFSPSSFGSWDTLWLQDTKGWFTLQS